MGNCVVESLQYILKLVGHFQQLCKPVPDSDVKRVFSHLPLPSFRTQHSNSIGIASEVPAAAAMCGAALPSPRPRPRQGRGAAVRAAAARAITTTQWKWAGVRSLSTSLTQFSSTTVLRAELFASATLNWMAVYTAKAYRLFQNFCYIFNIIFFFNFCI